MKKVNLEHVANIAKKAGKVVAGVALIAAYASVSENTYAVRDRKTTYTYSDAVDAIMESDMFSADKRQAVSLLRRYGTSEFYKAVILVVKNESMWSSDKLNTIRDLAQE